MSKNIITDQFRAAGKLINEWRDTLSYGALGAATVAGMISPEAALMSSLFREAARALGWVRDKTPIPVGVKTKISDFTLAASADTMTSVIVTGYAALAGKPEAAALGLALGTTSLMLAGGPRAVWEAYRDVMWDYPRKKDDGGPTQTQKLKDGGKELLQQLVDQVTPAPTPVPVPVRARSAAQPRQKLHLK